MSHKRYRLPKLRAAGDGTTRILVRDYSVRLSLLPRLPKALRLTASALKIDRISPAIIISIRSGFRTDGASIPVPLRRFIGNPFDTVRLIAAVCHDAIYATHLVPRIVADFIYYLALRQCSHMPRAYAFAEYLALRAGGKAAWNEKTPSDIAEGRRLVRVRFKVFKWRSGGVKSGGVNSPTQKPIHSPTPPLTH